MSIGGIGPITNTRSLKGALRETIGQLERARQKPTVVRLLKRCRDYRVLVEGWDRVSPPADEQFETIGQIMQLLGTAMQAAKKSPAAAKKSRADRRKTDDPTVEFHSIEPLGEAFEDWDDAAPGAGGDIEDVTQHQELELDLDLVPASSPRSKVVEHYRLPWQDAGRGVSVKTIKNVDGRHHALVRIDSGAQLTGRTHQQEENLFVLDGCISHAGAIIHAGACLRLERGAKSGTIKAIGEVTLLVMDSERRLKP